MSVEHQVNPTQLQTTLEKLSDNVQELAQQHQGDSVALLSILRALESWHQTIRDSLFQESLPDNRQALYNLLKDIEATGGWPYIHRMRLQAFLSQLENPEPDEIPPLLTNLTAPSLEEGQHKD